MTAWSADLFRRLQVALDHGVLHELDVAEVREALAPHRVGRGVDADLDLDAGEVADRVRVFAARQPPDRDPSRIAPAGSRRIRRATP